MAEFVSLPFLYIYSLLAGNTYCHTEGISGMNEAVNEGDLWEMEVDLRSKEKQKRTVHWFVRGNEQKTFFKGVPDRVEFGV